MQRLDGKPHRGSPRITAIQRAQFLESFREFGNITHAAKVAGFDPSTAYYMRDRDPEFAQALLEAKRYAADNIEMWALEQAKGTLSPVVNMGRIVKDDNGDILYEKKYSPQVLLRLLDAHKPEKYGRIAQAASTAMPSELTPDPPPTPDEDVPENPVL